jgi:purine/pyrimidine-nucleoside phosphorylase
MQEQPKQFDGVSVICKANVYFDGKVVSHTVLFKDGTKKTLGLIYPGEFKFNTAAPEKMEIISGSCRVKQKDGPSWTDYKEGTFFKVPGDSYFEVAVDGGVTEYICSFE